MTRRQREYDGDLRQLASMRAFLREVCHESGQEELTNENLVHRLELALTEAVSNIILHSLQGQQDRSITVTVAVADDEVRVTLQHTGKPFDLQTAAAPVFDGSRESGFGVYIMGQCVDEVLCGQDGEGRCVMHLVHKRKQHHKGDDDEARG